MKYPRLSPEDEADFLSALDNIWSAIGYDVLGCVAQEKGLRNKRTGSGFVLCPAEQVTMRRSEVICIVTDNFANGAGLSFIEMPKEQYERIHEWMFKTPGHIVDKIVAKRFDCKYYGA